MNHKRWPWRVGAGLAVLAGIWLVYTVLGRGRKDALVVYCAHDALHAESILRAFEKETGIPVIPRFDTEATKSLGLVELLLRERHAPRCDVFWNNQLLGTADLARQGLLEPYRGPGHRRIPDAFKDPEGRWTGFAARLRVFIVNTERLAPTPEAVNRALQGDLHDVALARPLYGTTLSHYAVLGQHSGMPALRAWYADWQQRGMREVNGNARVAGLVASGVCKLGLTDTDDFFAARDQGRPVAMLPVGLAENPDRNDGGQLHDAKNGAVILIPNTVAIIRGTPRLARAQKLVDYLLSESTELALSRGRARQIPLGPVDEHVLPVEVRALVPFVPRAIPLLPAMPSRDECIAWLR